MSQVSPRSALLEAVQHSWPHNLLVWCTCSHSLCYPLHFILTIENSFSAGQYWYLKKFDRRTASRLRSLDEGQSHIPVLKPSCKTLACLRIIWRQLIGMKKDTSIGWSAGDFTDLTWDLLTYLFKNRPARPPRNKSRHDSHKGSHEDQREVHVAQSSNPRGKSIL